MASAARARRKGWRHYSDPPATSPGLRPPQVPMIGYKKRKLLLALSGLLLLLLLLRLRSMGPFWAFLGSPCRAPAAFARAQLDLVRAACTGRPRDNFYSASRGMLKRSERAPASARCYLWPAGVEVPARETPLRGPLLSLRCRVVPPEQEDQEPRQREEQQSALLMPAVPRDAGRVAAAPDGAWNVVVLGLGGLSRRMWAQELPQSFQMLAKEFKNAISTRLVPLAKEPQPSLEAMLRRNRRGPWITEEFAQRHFLTQGGVFASASSQPGLEVPAALNLSVFAAARSRLPPTSGCIGVAPEGSVLLSWLRDGHFVHGGRRLFTFLHFADLVFPSMARLDADLLAFLLDFRRQPAFSRSLLLLYSLPDLRCGLEPGLLFISAPPDSAATGSFRWDMLQAATVTDDFFTPNDVNRILAFLASDDRPHHLADIGYDARTCAKLGIAEAACRCIAT